VPDGLLHRARGDADDAASGTLLEVREAQPHKPDGGDEQQLEGGFQRVVADLRCPCGRWATRVPDDDVDAAERLDGLRDDTLEIADIRHVTPYPKRADPVCLPVELLAAAGEHGDVCAFVGEGFSRRQPETGRCAADDRGPAAKTKLHGGGTVARQRSDAYAKALAKAQLPVSSDVNVSASSPDFTS
jgi:hypothetical protein